MGSLTVERVSGWRTALKLGRVSNVPTVWSNVIAGSALAGGAPLHLVIAISIIISLMYVAGMFLNDAFDRNVDAVERPERPIPAGEITADAVFVVGFSLLIVGIVALAAVNDGVGLAGLALGGAILLYNWHHKRNPAAPFVMGLCRALVYVAAASAAAARLRIASESLPVGSDAAAVEPAVFMNALDLKMPVENLPAVIRGRRNRLSDHPPPNRLEMRRGLGRWYRLSGRSTCNVVGGRRRIC